jgi:hypothetical protein
LGNLSDYFERRQLHKPVYNIGDRVRGIVNGTPISGTVGNDTLVSLEEGPFVIVHLDLPVNGATIMKCKHKDIGLLEKFTFNLENKSDNKRKTAASRKSPSGKARSA